MLITEDQFHNHFEAIRSSGINLGDTCLEPCCPICRSTFSNKSELQNATKEDAPPNSLGGSRVCLTCKNCNNSAGRNIDIHLVNYIKRIDQSQYKKGSNRRISVLYEDKEIHGNLIVGENQDLNLEIPKRINDIRILDSILSSWNENTVLNFKNDKIKLLKERLDTGIIKTAYILLFAKIGYNALIWKEYNKIRSQIQNPEQKILPRLWSLQKLFINDGIYSTNECWIRGFFVIFSVINPDTGLKHRFAVLIPAPQSDFIAATFFLNRIKPGDKIRIENLNNLDLLTNPKNIRQLHKWAHGDSLRIACL